MHLQLLFGLDVRDALCFLGHTAVESRYTR